MNYTSLVSRIPPDGLWESARDRLDTYGLVYSKEFVCGTSPDEIIGERTGKKRPIVRCTCSACGETFYRPWMGMECPDGATYGFLEEGSCSADAASSGDSMICPVCGTPVSIKCASRVGSDRYAGARAFITAKTSAMSAQLLPGESGHRPLALVCWNLRRYCTFTGSDIKVILPVDAYVFDESGRYKLVGVKTAYSGKCGYFTIYQSQWSQPKSWREDWGRQDLIYGLTPELIAESCLSNSRLWECMQSFGARYPVAYLSLWQQWPAVENLPAQGAGYLLNELIGEQVKSQSWEKNRRGLHAYDILDVGQRRPSAMLGLTREEFRRMTRDKWSADLLRLYLARKSTGELLTDEDIKNAFMLGEPLVLAELPAWASAGRAARYLLKQIELAAEEYLYDPDVDLYCDPAEYCMISAGLLRDYWEMAGRCGWDLSDPDIKWPKHLEAAHDRAAEAERTIISKQSSALFRRRYEELKKYSFAYDGIMIKPCINQKQLTREGKELHHCVAGYAEDIVKGKTSIFFIRRAAKPSTPWYTLEFDVDRLEVKQNRGKRNCARTPEVKAFEALWLDWIHAGCPRDRNGEPVIKNNKEEKTA